jgi:hypothetical protein
MGQPLKQKKALKKSTKSTKSTILSEYFIDHPEDLPKIPLKNPMKTPNALRIEMQTFSKNK